jgi:hypothetical protein
MTVTISQQQNPRTDVAANKRLADSLRAKLPVDYVADDKPTFAASLLDPRQALRPGADASRSSEPAGSLDT